MTSNDNNTAPTPAEAARDALAASIDKARAAGLAALRKAYGAEADNASVTLALKAARVMAGGDKPRGGAAQRINDTIKAVKADGAEVTAATLHKAARAVLDAHKAAEAARRAAVKAERQAARDKLNDRGAPKADRIAALEVMTRIDAEASDKAATALAARVRSALEAARNGGMTVETVASIMGETFPGWDIAVTRSPLAAVDNAA